MENTNEPHSGSATKPKIGDLEQALNAVFRLPEDGAASVNVYQANNSAIYELMTNKFIEIDALLGPTGTTTVNYTGECMTTKNLGLTIPGRGEAGWEKVIADNFLIIDKALGELQAAGKKLEEDAQWYVACVFCGKRKGDHFGPETDPMPACYRGNPMGRRFMAEPKTVVPSELLGPPSPEPYTFGNGTMTIKGVSLTPAGEVVIGATLRGEELCEDEGCPQHGTPHVCNPATGDGRVLPLSTLSDITVTAPEPEPKDLEEGDPCTQEDCKGILSFDYRTDDCSCHISPPCSQCVEKLLRCNECGFEVDVNEQNYGADGSGGH